MKIAGCLLLSCLAFCDARKVLGTRKNDSGYKKPSGQGVNLAVHSASIAASGSDYPWIVSIFEFLENQDIKKIGPGVIVNKNHALSHSMGVDQILITDNVRLVSKSNAMGIYNGRGVVVRNLVNFIYNFENNEGHNIAILKFSSRVKDDGIYAPMPLFLNKIYDVGMKVQLYNFGDSFYQLTKNIGPESDCAAYGYDNKVTFCTEFNPEVPVNFEYPGTIAMIGERYAGFCIGSGKGGESFLDIRKFLPWINKNVK